MSKPLRVLVVEDSALDAEVVIGELRRAGFVPEWKRVETKADFLAALDTSPDLILSDYALPHFDGVRAVQLLRERGLDIPFILISGTLGEEAAVEAMKQGANDYLLKDRIARLGPAVERALEEKRLCDERRHVEEKLAASERHLRAIFENEPECVKLLAADGSLLEINPAGLRMLEADSFQQVENDCVYPLVVEEHRAAFRALNERVFAGESGVLEFEIVGLKGGRRWLETHASPLRDTTGKVTALLGITRDITVRKQAEAIIACQTQVLDLIARGVPLADTLTTMLQSMEAFAPGMIGSVLLLDADRQRFQLGAAPGLPDAFNRAIDNEPIGPNAGSCGTAAFRRELVIVEDIATDPLWTNYRELALAHGLRACWSTPIFDEQREVLGTFAIYYREPGRPTTLHRRCIDLATGLAAIAISRERGEAALRASEARFRAIFEQAAVGVAQVAPDGRWLDVNQRLCEIVAYSREELLAGSFQAITHPDDLEADLDFVRRMLAAEIATYAMEKRYRRKDRSLVWVHLTVSLVRGTLAVPLYFISVVKDISERKRAEAEAERQRVELQTILDAVPALIFYKDREGRFLRVNRELARLVGAPPEAFVGKTDTEMGSPYGERHREDDLRVMTSGESIRHLEEPIHTVDGPRWLLTNKVPHRDETGRIAGIIGFAVDITARKRAEEALHRQHALLTVVVEGTSDAVFAKDVEGRYQIINAAGARALGKTMGEVIGRTDGELIPPEVAQRFRETDEEVVASGQARVREEQAVLPTGIRYFQANKAPWRDADGRIVGIIGVSRDITESKQAEAALRQLNAELEQRVAERTAELEEANQELDSFSHSVSHDLRAPLRAISGFGQFLSEDCASTLDERGRGHLRRMMEAASQMSRLIDDLLQFAHASRSELRRQPVDLSALAQEVVRDLQQAAPERRVQFLCAPGLNVSGDVRLLRVVLVNLLGNAWKYTGKAAEPRVELGRLDGGGETTFFIRDNGAGFDMKYVDRLFGAFQRLHSMAEFEGTGVGLATVQRIIHRHGGKIRAEAKVNEGATFHFTLPEKLDHLPAQRGRTEGLVSLPPWLNP